MNTGRQFLSVTWTDDIPDNEVIMILRDIHSALRQALKYMPHSEPAGPVNLPEIKPFGYWTLQGAESRHPYSSAGWYMDRSYDRQQGRFFAWRYLDLVMNEPFQHHAPHYDLAILHFPLYDTRVQQEVMGVDIPGMAAVISTAKLNGLSIRHERPMVLRRLVSHYAGRVIGIPFIDRGEPNGCSGACAMRPARDLSEWVDLAEEETQANVTYCEACRRQLSAQIASNQLGLN
jgi:predicted Zn-dependent protease